MSKAKKTEAPAPPGDYQVLELSTIRPSPTNPRKRFDEVKLEELAASIKAKGVLQPILVRPVRIAQTTRTKLTKDITVAEVSGYLDAFELIAGERRFRAAKLAGLDTIRAIVADLTDREALEIQVIENEQREDVLPSEKAAGYQQLLTQGATVEEIAGRIGKSMATVRGILLLARMPPGLAEAVDEGKLPRTTAELVCRVPSADLRERAAAEVLRGHAWSTAPMSFREAKDHIEANYTVELKGAPFKLADAKLCQEAGSCKDCPKRVGNLQKEDPETWNGARADVCTDPGCYRNKVFRQQEKDRQKAQLAGLSCLDRGEGERLMPYGNIQGPPWVDLADHCYELDTVVDDHGDCPQLVNRTWEQALEGLPVTIWFAHDARGHGHRLVKEKEAVKALIAAGLIRDPDAPQEKPSLTKAAQAAAQAAKPPKPSRVSLSHRAARIAGQVLYEMGANNPEGLEGLSEQGDSTTNAAWEALKLLCLATAWESGGGDGREVQALADKVLSMVDYLGGEDDERGQSGLLAAFRSWIDRAEPAQLIGFLLKAAALRLLTYPESPGNPAQALLDWAEMDWCQLLEQATREAASPTAEEAVAQ